MEFFQKLLGGGGVYCRIYIFFKRDWWKYLGPIEIEWNNNLIYFLLYNYYITIKKLSQSRCFKNFQALIQAWSIFTSNAMWRDWSVKILLICMACAAYQSFSSKSSKIVDLIAKLEQTFFANLQTFPNIIFSQGLSKSQAIDR